jgi:hypothetical protein
MARFIEISDNYKIPPNPPLEKGGIEMTFGQKVWVFSNNLLDGYLLH